MLININEIKIGSNRREAAPEDVKALAESIAEVGMMNPITVDAESNLVAGLHRLEAAKLLGWTEIECNVCELDKLHAELAEIDENVVRTGLSDLELSELLARRKKIYETLHPETRHGGDRCSEKSKATKCRDASVKSFAQDTAEKMGVSPRTVERSVQIAENLTPEAKEVLRSSERKITKRNMADLTSLKPEQQKEAAEGLVSGEFKSVDDYRVSKGITTLEEWIADLKNTDKDCRCTPESFTEETIGNLLAIQWELSWIEMPYYQEVYQSLSQEQIAKIQSAVNTIHAALDNFISEIESAQQKECDENVSENVPGNVTLSDEDEKEAS